MSRGRSFLWVLLLLLVPLSGCGKKGPPVPLEVREPARVGDLTLIARDGRLFLQWSIPTANTDGTRLEDLVGFRVFRQERPDSQATCLSCPDSFEAVAEIDVDFPRGAQVEGGRVLWEDRRLRPDHEYVYYVVAYNSEKVPSAPSKAVRKLWGVPPEAPRDLQIEPLDRALRLKWRFSGERLDGERLSEGPFLLTLEELIHPALLALKLWNREDRRSRFLWQRLSPETRRQIESYDFSVLDGPSFHPVAERLVQDLNEMLKGPAFCEAEAWAEDCRSLQGKKWMSPREEGEDRMRRNRILLEAAFPREIQGHRREFGGFHLYRRPEGERWGLSPLTPEPIFEDQYLDGDLENGKKYFYSVHAIRNLRGSLIEGPGTPERAGIPERRWPPSPPTGLSASRTSRGIELRWNRNPEGEGIGYEVYRREEGAGEFQKIHSHTIRDEYFLDGSAEPQKTYRYRVRSIDPSTPLRKSDFSLEVECPPSPSPPSKGMKEP